MFCADIVGWRVKWASLCGWPRITHCALQWGVWAMFEFMFVWRRRVAFNVAHYLRIINYRRRGDVEGRVTAWTNLAKSHTQRAYTAWSLCSLRDVSVWPTATPLSAATAHAASVCSNASVLHNSQGITVATNLAKNQFELAPLVICLVFCVCHISSTSLSFQFQFTVRSRFFR